MSCHLRSKQVEGGVAASGKAWNGDGSDGSKTVSGTETMIRDMHWTAVTVPNGAILDMGGNILFCTGTVTVDSGGIIRGSVATAGQDGAPGTGAGFGGSGGTGGTGGAGGTSLGAGASGEQGGSGGNAPAGSGSAPSFGGEDIDGEGGANGGAGGAGEDQSGFGGGFGGAAGSAGTRTLIPDRALRSGPRIYLSGGTPTAARVGAGGAPGGGGGAGPNPAPADDGGGGGGSGASYGPLEINCDELVNNGELQSCGTNGGNGGAGAFTGGGGGGGGGGAGGHIKVTARSFNPSGTCNVNGGNGGTGAGLGANGSSGSNGTVTLLTMESGDVATT